MFMLKSIRVGDCFVTKDGRRRWRLEQIKPLYWGDGGTGYCFAVFENDELLMYTWFRPDEVRNFFFYPSEGDIAMDPNCCLTEMRKLYKRIIDGETLPDDDMDRLAELIESLDDWLVSGGFLPTEWSKIRESHG